MAGSSGTQAAPGAHGLRQAPPLQVRPSPQGLPSHSVSRQSTKPSQSSSTPPEQAVSVAATGLHIGPVTGLPPQPPQPPSATSPMTLWAPQPAREEIKTTDDDFDKQLVV